MKHSKKQYQFEYLIMNLADDCKYVSFRSKQFNHHKPR